MTCALCDSQQLTIVSTKDAKSKAPLDVAVCQRCGLVQQTPIPTDEELSQFYSHDYRAEYKQTLTPKPKHIYRAGMKAEDRLDYLARHGVTSGTLLDIGAGGGEFVYLAGKRGFEARGIDPNVGYSTFARDAYDIRIDTGEMADIEGSYDNVTMFHVLEHMPRPVWVFETLWSIVRPGGTVFIEVPHIETAAASPGNIYFKAHIFYFSAATLAACASSGFDVIDANKGAELRMLFKRRDEKRELQLPSQADVDHTLARLKQKGWLEYLTQGGGWAKLFHKLRQSAIEKRYADMTGKQILDSLAS